MRLYHYPAVAGSALFPLDGQGWVGAGSEATYNGHNYGSTLPKKLATTA